MVAPQVEAIARPTQWKNLKPIYMGPLQDTKQVTNLEQPKYIYECSKARGWTQISIRGNGLCQGMFQGLKQINIH